MADQLAARAEAHLPDLAMSLNNLAVRLTTSSRTLVAIQQVIVV